MGSGGGRRGVVRGAICSQYGLGRGGAFWVDCGYDKKMETIAVFLLALGVVTPAMAKPLQGLALPRAGGEAQDESPQWIFGIKNAQEVAINGMRFIRVSKGAFSLYVPKLLSYSAPDFDRAFCAPNSY